MTYGMGGVPLYQTFTIALTDDTDRKQAVLGVAWAIGTRTYMLIPFGTINTQGQYNKAFVIWYFYTQQAADTAYFRVYNVTAAAAITESETTTVSLTPVTAKSPIWDISDLITDQEFAIEMKGSDAGATANVHKAVLVLYHD